MRLTSILLLLTLTLIACHSGNDAWQRIEQSGTLRVGLDPTYPPFENLTGDGLAGIDIDLMREIGQDLGIEIHFDLIGYDGLYDALLTGRVDVLASALIVDETRTKEFAFSEPYFNVGQVLVVADGSPVDSLADVGTIAVELGAAGHVVATQEQKLRALKIVSLDSAETALNSVLNNEAPAALTDSISARLFLAANPSLRIANNAITVEPYALVTRAGDATLMRNLNAALDTISDNGKLELILGNYLD